MSSSVVIRFGHRYWFHDQRKLNRAERADRRADQRHGDVAEEAEVPTPSIVAASRRSVGSVRNTWRSRKMPNAVARNGTASPW